MKTTTTNMFKFLALLIFSFGTSSAQALEPSELIGSYKTSQCEACYLQIYPDENGVLRGNYYPWGSSGTSASDGWKPLSLVTSTRIMFMGNFYDALKDHSGTVVLKRAR